MAWTTPRTWVAGELVTAALLNTHLRDNLNFWADTPHELQVSRSTNQTITTSTRTLISWNSEERDVGFTFSPTSSTVTVQQTGIYTVSLGVQFDGDSTSTGCGIEIEISGLTLVPRSGQGGWCPAYIGGARKSCVVTQKIEAGQTIKSYVFHNKGSNMDIVAASGIGVRLYVAQVNRTLEG